MIPKENGREIEFNEKIVNVIRGKSLTYPEDVGNEIRVLCRMLDWFESSLDRLAEDDFFGADGWRDFFGIE